MQSLSGTLPKCITLKIILYKTPTISEKTDNQGGEILERFLDYSGKQESSAVDKKTKGRCFSRIAMIMATGIV